jgi:hypothetical protein
LAASSTFGGGPADLMVWNVGEASARVLLADGQSNKPDDWSPDGKFVVFRRNDRTTALMPVQPGSKPLDTGDSDTVKDEVHVSPDGRLAAYNTAGVRPEVFVAQFPGMKGTIQVSANGGTQPIWTRGGGELIYASPDKQLMSVNIRAGATIEATSPRPLFRTAGTFPYWANQYAVSSDGQRIYLLDPVGSTPDAWHVLTRWQEVSRP